MPLSPPLDIITVDTISSGAHALREMMPAIAPAYTSLSAYSPATAPSADVTWKDERHDRREDEGAAADFVAAADLHHDLRERRLTRRRRRRLPTAAPGSEASAALMLAATRLGAPPRRERLRLRARGEAAHVSARLD